MKTIKWNKKALLIKASEYTNKTAFIKENPGAYTAAKKQNCIDEICSHMIRQQHKEYTFDEILQIALPYETLKEFRKKHSSLITISRKNGWYDKITKHMFKEHNITCTFREAIKEASKYNKRIDFQKGSPIIYRICSKKGWLDKICSHMIIAIKNYKKLSFNDAREKARSLNLKSRKHYVKYIKNNKLYEFYSSPDKCFKEWTNWMDYLGTNNIDVNKQHNEFLSYNDAKLIIQKLNLETSKEYFTYHSINKPIHIPHSPQNTYKDNGWKSWNEWLGSSNIYNKERNKNFPSYNDAKKIIQCLNIKSSSDYRDYVRNSNCNLPLTPESTYKNNGWLDWFDYLNTNKIENIDLIRTKIKNAKSNSHWNIYDNVKNAFKNSKNLSEINNNGEGGAIKSAKRNGWFVDLCKKYFNDIHIESERLIYAFFFSDMSCYIGLTNNLVKRKGQHLRYNVIKKHIDETGLFPLEPIQLSKFVSENDATELESFYYYKFRDEFGFNMLNDENMLGMLGGGGYKYSEEMLISIISNYKNISELREKEPNVYSVLKQRKLLRLLTSNLHRKKRMKGDCDNKNECEKYALLCKNRTEYAHKYSGLNKGAIRNGWLDEFFPITIK